MLTAETATREKLRGRVDVVVLCAGAILAILLFVLQGIAMVEGFRGPVEKLLSDYVATPESNTIAWVGLLLACVGLSNRHRLITLSAALALDVVFTVARLLADGPLATGNGPLIVLTAVILVAALRMSGGARTNALQGAALGALVIVANKCAAAWLVVTAIKREFVLDEYVEAADHALGNPAWIASRVMDVLGKVGEEVIDWVYIQWPIGALIVSLWQLRGRANGDWPSHFLVRTFLLIGIIGPIFYILFPVVGPVFAYGTAGNGFEIANYWPAMAPPFDATPQAVPFDDSTPRNCMPSLHTAWAVAVFVHSRQGPRWLRFIGSFWLGATILATLGFGAHYGVDLIAGTAFALTIESALRDPERGYGWWRIRLVSAFTVTFAALLLSYRFIPVTMGRYPEIFGPILIGILLAVIVAFRITFFGRNAATDQESEAEVADPAVPVSSDAAAIARHDRADSQR